jgi:hypothetical protein
MPRRHSALSVIVGLSLLLAACAAPAAPTATPAPLAGVSPIDAILAAGPEFVDIGPDTATLRAETTIAVACAVVYGETPAYGHIATDSDMAGGGHSDHHPVLRGLKPDTLYYARIQGVGPDGTLYRSEEYTFHTTAAVETTGPLNLALPANGGRVAGVSSNYGGGAR